MRKKSRNALLLEKTLQKIAPSHNSPMMHTPNRSIRLTQCCTQFKSPGVKILCVLYLHYNVAFSFKCMEIPETKSFIPKGFELGTTLS